MFSFHSDLTLESAEQLGVTGEKAAGLSGVRLTQRQVNGYQVTTIHIATEQGAKTLHRPKGRYITVDLSPFVRRQKSALPDGIRCLCRQIRTLLPRLTAEDTVLVVGLGNRRLSCDAVGPATLDHLLVTRHMRSSPCCSLPQVFPVAAIATGVAGQTGIESCELIAGTAERLSPSAVIVIDALCAYNSQRLCTTVQFSDTGLTPGSGVGNHRQAIDRSILGVPVIAIGVPTVITGHSLAQELSGRQTMPTGDLFLTPRDVSSRVCEISRLLGYSITAALQPKLSLDDILALLN